MKFNPKKHVFKSPKVHAIITEAIDFLNQTSPYQLPLPEPFIGTGVYCLYYFGSYDLYKKIADANVIECTQPIYVGKAVPKGWRTARCGSEEDATLTQRLHEHARSIKQGAGLDIKDFKCRFMILKGEESSMITIVEAAFRGGIDQKIQAALEYSCRRVRQPRSRLQAIRSSQIRVGCAASRQSVGWETQRKITGIRENKS